MQSIFASLDTTKVSDLSRMSVDDYVSEFLIFCRLISRAYILASQIKATYEKRGKYWRYYAR